jgi:hypothetical protein
MQEESIIAAQLEFYKRGKAGCLFAAHAANNPAKFGWRLTIAKPERRNLIAITESAIALSAVSTQSIIFPSVLTPGNLKELLLLLRDTSPFFLETEKRYRSCVCLGFRLQVGDLVSWVTGFGGYNFLPKTRQAIFTEIVFRTKPRPDYDRVMKKSPEGVIHLADMDMQGMSEHMFKSLWHGSFANTEEILGKKPDLRSAARTTFAVPQKLWTSR